MIYYPVIHIINFKFSRRISTQKLICGALQITVYSLLYIQLVFKEFP